MYNKFNINEELINLSKKVDEKIKDKIKEIDELCMYNSIKVLKAFHQNHISYSNPSQARKVNASRL